MSLMAGLPEHVAKRHREYRLRTKNRDVWGGYRIVRMVWSTDPEKRAAVKRDRLAALERWQEDERNWCRANARDSEIELALDAESQRIADAEHDSACKRFVACRYGSLLHWLGEDER